MEPIWYPKPEEARATRLFRFMEALGFQDYEAFYRYSVEELEDFYGQFFTHLGIPWRRPYERVVSGTFPLPQFFPGGRLNLVEAALSHEPAALALVHETEEGGVRTLTYGELFQEVERVAAGLRALGVERGDRVGLWFPMGLEAAILLLATAWLGAIAIPIFSGYAAEAAAVRLKDAKAKLLAVQDGFHRRGRRVELLPEARKAQALAEEALAHALGLLRPGVLERDVALEIEFFLKRRGAEVAFPPIVASGMRGALPHAGASGKALEAGELVTLDLGARVEGYHSDMTRTVALGRVDGELKRAFEATLAALERVLENLGPGKSTKEMDALAREELRRFDLDRYFVHSLGHGVGLAVHEGPGLSPYTEETLEAGMVVTVEPGVYLPGIGGVRIEELVLIRETGIELLSRFPRGWREV
ncbi:MAG: M24 family metallopeptidase [Thermus sp.]